MKEKLPQKFCGCIKKVRKTLKGSRAPPSQQPPLRQAQAQAQTQTKESRAIAICVTSVLQKKRGRTLKKFKCGKKPMLETQRMN